MKQRYVFLMLGIPGSGKSSFAERLAQKLSAVHLNSDAMRLAIFKSRAETDRIYHSDQRSTLNTYTFGALNYAASSVLGSGSSVIYDACNNTQQERLDIAQELKQDHVYPVVIWVQTPFEEAVKRAVRRSETNMQRQFSEKEAREYITRINSEIEEPSYNEKLIIIDGSIPFQQQYESYKDQLAEMERE